MNRSEIVYMFLIAPDGEILSAFDEDVIETDNPEIVSMDINTGRHYLWDQALMKPTNLILAVHASMKTTY